MNAIELADVMEKYSVAGFQYPLCEEFKQVATMLRQQQVELAISENLIKHLYSENKELRLETEQQQVEIKMLKETIQGRDKYIDLIMESYEKGFKND